MARIELIKGGKTKICGGVLLSRMHVLTAAHCLDEKVKNSYFVYVGDIDQERVREVGEQKLGIRDWAIHPQYNKTKYLNDIGIITLDWPGAVFNENVSAISLPDATASYQPGQSCSIAGWGISGPGSGVERYLKTATVDILSQGDCQAQFPQKNLTDGMFCAGK